MRKLTLVFCILLLTITFCGIASAAVPHLINYQGRLTDISGVPLNGLYNITLRIYDAESAGNLLWQGTYSSISVNKGIFNILLGDVNDSGFNFANLAFDMPYWLEIKVGSDSPMYPRQRITSAGYAINSENGVPKGAIIMWSGSITGIPSGWALCNGANGTPDLRDKFIVGGRQDDGGVIKTNVSGSLTQTGGEAYHVLTIAEMPAHTHTTTVASVTTAGHEDGGRLSDINHDPNSPLVITSSSTGGAGAHNNLPPYYALAYIMKL